MKTDHGQGKTILENFKYTMDYRKLAFDNRKPTVDNGKPTIDKINQHWTEENFHLKWKTGIEH